MEKLKCEESSCKHNQNYFCSKKTIAIDQRSNCVSYQKRTLKEEYEYEIADELFSNEFMAVPNVYCNDLECVHNKNKACAASQVEVGKTLFQAVHCKTFSPKQ